MKTIEGHLGGEGLRVALVASRFNDFITDHLVKGALDALQRCGVKEEAIDLVRVPGSFEIPPVAKRMAESRRYDAVVCLSTVIRGATPHFEYVATEVSKGVAAVALETGVPIAFGVLTTDTIEQAIERAGTKQGNKGFEAALVAVEMATLLRALPGGK
ncbi:MAG: 6,7-dimethyl-8-ribityllumazine synthase [Nitrospinota bacterium]